MVGLKYSAIFNGIVVFAVDATSAKTRACFPGVSMYLLLCGLVLIGLKYLQIGPVADWAWWWVLSPLAVTAAWWAWADASGYSKRKAMEKMEQRKQDRINRQRQAMGTKPRPPR